MVQATLVAQEAGTDPPVLPVLPFFLPPSVASAQVLPGTQAMDTSLYRSCQHASASSGTDVDPCGCRAAAPRHPHLTSQ